MDKHLTKWRQEGGHLPQVLRDFHDQKDVFKAMHELTDVQGNDYTKDISWMAGHCYVIDIFLWFMARHGYTLQRSRAKQSFEDLVANVEACNQRRNDAFAKALGLTPVEPKEAP